MPTEEIYSSQRSFSSGQGKSYTIKAESVPSYGSQLAEYVDKLGFAEAAGLLAAIGAIDKTAVAKRIGRQALTSGMRAVAPHVFPPFMAQYLSNQDVLPAGVVQGYIEGQRRRQQAQAGAYPGAGSEIPSQPEREPTTAEKQHERKAYPGAGATPPKLAEKRRARGAYPGAGAGREEGDSVQQAAIRRAEGTTDEKARAAGFESGYDLPLGYGKYGRPPKPLTQMTLDEVHAFGRTVRARHGSSSAVGAFQITGTTMRNFQKEAGLTGKDLFSPANQRKLAAVIARRQGLQAWEGFKYHPNERRIAEQAGAATAPFKGGGGTFGGGGATGTIAPAAAGQAANVREMQAGIRKQPISSQLRGQLDYAGGQTGLIAEVTSGGQPAKGTGGLRTGSTRHDVGGAADLKLRDKATGRVLDMRNPKDQARMSEFVSHAVRAGATGVGAGLGYMGPHTIHVGGGKATTWGGASWAREAWAKGRSTGMLPTTAPAKKSTLPSTESQPKPVYPKE